MLKNGIQWTFVFFLTLIIILTRINTFELKTNAVSVEDFRGTHTYIFGKGYSCDTINEWGNDHSIVELIDVNTNEINVSNQWENNLIISINDTDDVLIINNFKWGQSSYSFRFADGAEGYVDKNTWNLILTKYSIADE